MKSVDHLVKIAEQFARKISLAQTVSAQPSDIDVALTNARVKPSSQDIAPLLNTAKIPEDVSLNIQLIVDPKLNTKFLVSANPPNNAAMSLKNILDKKYTGAMTQALQKANIQVAGPVTVNIATF